MDAVVRDRVIGSLALAAGVFAGVELATTPLKDLQQRVEKIEAKRATPDAARERALTGDYNYRRKEFSFESELGADLIAMGLAQMELDDLKKPNHYEDALDKPLVLKPRKKWASDHLELRASLEKVKFQQRGVEVSARHTVLRVKNISNRPIAYYVAATAATQDSKCKARGSRYHNAMSLLPGEVADMVVCAGTHNVLVSDVKVLEVSAVGYLYAAKVPPQAVGYDHVAGRAHRPPRKVKLCTGFPAVMVSNQIRAGTVGWDDVMDFYSRHDCSRYQFWSGYKRAETALSKLPALPEQR